MNFGLYIHIPFCQNICHYCDFSKTARFDPSLIKNYFDKITHQVKWAKSLGFFSQGILTSVNFGGGTPGLFGIEFQRILEELAPYFSDQTEISLEANPNNLTNERINLWKALGFNRLSVGVQTFSDVHLQYLKRDHSGKATLEAIMRAHEKIPNLNIDLIYGMKDQTLEEWFQDLEIFSQLPVQHGSFYNLTYHEQTPIGRRVLRGKEPPPQDQLIENMYILACQIMAEKGFCQEEVSNWYRPGFEARHNTLYWTQESYLGLGVGSCGFLPTSDGLGLRYQTTQNLSSYLKAPDEDFMKLLSTPKNFSSQWFLVDDRPTSEYWLMEAISCGLRYEKGLDLQRIKEITGYEYSNKNQIPKQIVWLDENGRLKLCPKEWIRENYWAGKVFEGFTLPKKDKAV